MDILYGDERFVKEVFYVCQGLLGEYQCIFDSSSLAGIGDGHVYLCAYDRDEREAELKEAGFIYGRNYSYSSELFLKMDEDYKHWIGQGKEKIAIWGCGNCSKDLGECKYIDFYIDSNAENVGSRFMGKPVLKPEDVGNWEGVYIYVAIWTPQIIAEIRNFLDEHGLKENSDYSTHMGIRYLRLIPSEMMTQTLNANPISNCACYKEVNKVDIDYYGDLFVCCGGLLTTPIGNVLRENGRIKDIWNGYLARIIKLSIINHTYVFCNLSCGKIHAGRIEGEFIYQDVKHPSSDYDKSFGDYPSVPTLGMDFSCNLKCTSCRNDYRMMSQPLIDHWIGMSDRLNSEWFSKADNLIVAGDGEVFYSKVYREYWINKDGKKRNEITVKTNGLLFNKDNWEFLKAGYNRINLHVSIDAASEEVYKRVRGGSWKVLCDNMEFAASLRRNNELKNFVIFFVVQQDNYKDIKEFIKLGHKWGVDGIGFAAIRNFGNYEDSVFSERVTLFEDGGRGALKDSFRSFFNDDSLKDPIARGLQQFVV